MASDPKGGRGPKISAFPKCGIASRQVVRLTDQEKTQSMGGHDNHRKTARKGTCRGRGGGSRWRGAPDLRGCGMSVSRSGKQTQEE